LAVLVPPQITTAEVPAGWKKGWHQLFVRNQCRFKLYAPNKDFVHVIGDFNNWEIIYLLKRNTSAERYWIQLDSIEKGKEYAFQYLINGTLAVADPYAEKILDPNNDQYIPSTTYPNLKTLLRL
jgi:1,4-alpha-glucan branching enzyme